jgi:thiol-disulfide isomerase/thioredoxin
MHRSIRSTAGALCVGVICLTAAASAATPRRPTPAGECLVAGRITSTGYARLGGGIERAIVYAYPATGGGDAVASVIGKGERFELRLPPGDYVLRFSAVGTRGATFQGDETKLTVRPGQLPTELPTVDLPPSKTTLLFGRPAPEIGNAKGWKNTAPGKLAELRGRVVVLDFFAHYCTICHMQAPELARIAAKYRGKGLAVLAVHDDSVASVEEMDQKMAKAVKLYWHGKDLAFPTVLDGGGENGIFRAYGIGGVPALIVIDTEGRVVRRFHQATDPEFEKEIQRLLADRAARR